MTNTTKGMEALTRTKDGSWPDDWYISSEGHVDGPYPSELVFQLKDQTISGYPRYLSRKGMKTWYRLSDLAPVYMDSAILSDPIVKQKMKVLAQKVEMDCLIKRYQGQIRPGQLPNNPRPQYEAPSVIDQTIGPEYTNEPMGRHKSVQPERQQGNPTTAQSSHKIEDLHLGSVQPLIQEGFYKFISTLGLYWAVWHRRCLIEINDHMGLESPSRMWSFMSLIPGLHILASLSLGSQIRKMEMQNGYKNTSLLATMLFSLFPPLAIFYLQNQLNLHWKTHLQAYYSLVDPD